MNAATGEGMYRKLTIRAVREVVQDVKVLEFEEAAGEEIRYRPGQYLTLVHFAGSTEVRRSYSITSTPVLNEPLAIGVKRIDNGFFSRKLVDHAQPGDWLYTTGAGGLFVLPAATEAYRQVFFLAAGSGITPVFSLLKTVLHAYPRLSAVLVYSNPAPEKAMFLHELQALAAAFESRLQIRFLFSNSQQLAGARLHRELLEAFLFQYGALQRQTLFYICGPEAYMRLCSYVLQEARVPAAHIKRENFNVQKTAPPATQPPDTGSHQVSVSVGAQRFRFAVHFPDTILQAARRNGYVLPYSCEAGRCGNCLARCNRGEVWLSYNEVLTEQELAKGLTLTCVGHPVHGDVDLTIAPDLLP